MRACENLAARGPNRFNRCQGLLGQCFLAMVAILGALATSNLKLADSIIPETVRIPPLRSSK
jgi:hypothetical protein